MMGFTSGSTGQPKAYPKLWRSMHGSTARNADAIRRGAGIADESGSHDSRDRRDRSAAAHVRHGAEHPAAAHRRHGRARRPPAVSGGHRARAGRSAGAARAREHAGAHAHRSSESSQPFPAHGADRFRDRAARSANWPRQSKRSSAAQLLEMFGSTETCVIARRRTATGEAWQRTKVSSCIRARTARWSRRRGSSSRCCCRISSNCSATASSSCAAAAAT